MVRRCVVKMVETNSTYNLNSVMNPKVSIIVPVYKAEPYLHRCIDSILAQTFTDWELLLIDDGSPDRSGEICDEYAKKDKRIRVFHKENGGVSSARNLGLEKMRGEYVMFVDSDDWIDVNTLDVCLDKIRTKHLDILQYSWKRVNEEGQVLKEKVIKSEVLELGDFVNNANFNVCVGGNFINTSIIRKNRLRFDTELKLGEDQVFIITALSYAERIQSIPNTFYNYYFNSESATNNTKLVDIENGISAMMKLKKRYPVFTSHCDAMLLNFTMDALGKPDVQLPSLIELYRESKISTKNVTDNHIKLFLLLDKINRYMAFWIMNKILLLER